MKKLLLNLVFTVCFSNMLQAQDLLLSEDFDYPIGNTLNKHNWKPLTTATDNPIKIVQGIRSPGYTRSGGAAYLGMTGQDVIRSFAPITDKIYLSFQIEVKKYFYLGKTNYPKPFSPSSYFMILSSKENPTVPLLKFSLVSTDFGGPLKYLVVRDSRNDIISVISIAPGTNDYNFSYQLSGVGSGEAYLRAESRNESAFSGDGLNPSKAAISNISNIVLSQSDVNIGTECVIDRIRIGKTWSSVVPCIPQFNYQDRFISSMSVWNYFEGGGISSNSLDPNEFKKKEIIIRACANKEILPQNLTAYLRTEIGSKVTDLEVRVPSGFKAVTKYAGGQTTNNLLRASYNYSDTNNSLNILLVGNSNKISLNGNPITGEAGVYEGEITFTPVGGYCQKTVWKVKGILENCPIISLNATVFPNVTEGSLNLKINNQEPEGEIEVKLSDNQGYSLFQQNGQWNSMKRELEMILSKQKEGQYFFTVKQGELNKTIRLVRQ